MQVAIDNAKRRFDIDLTGEIRRIRNDMDIKENGYPAFWSLIQRNFKRSKIHYGLHCPMNCLYDLELTEFHPDTTTLPMSHFFIKHTIEKNYRTCKKVEELIQQYSLDIYNCNDDDSYLLLRNDYDNFINSIQMQYISSTYIGLFSWLIDRAFLIIPQTKGKSAKIESNIDKNKSILLKSLYDINCSNLLKCFSKNSHF